MTDGMMNFRDLVEKAPDADLLREMISFAAERLMELEVGAMTGAAYGEKDPDRLVQRADSDDAAHPIQDDGAHHSEMMAPT
jgi:putative transposase